MTRVAKQKGRSDRWMNLGELEKNCYHNDVDEEMESVPKTRWSITKWAISYFREDDVGGRARVTTDEERVLRGRWTEMKVGGWI